MIWIRVPHTSKAFFYLLLQIFFFVLLQGNEGTGNESSVYYENVRESTEHSLSDVPLVAPTTSFTTTIASATTAQTVASFTQRPQATRKPAEKSLQPVCLRPMLVDIVEQMQRKNRDTSKCLTENTIVQETLELPQINYASRDCLAKVVSVNEEAVNTNAILDDKDNDLYMRNPCEKARDKFLIVRLCDRIKPTLIEIANLEFFSSAPKDIRISMSRTYPTTEWVLLGAFEMPNRREVQRFPVPDTFDQFVKFLKLELISHYGKEYYCTLSFLRVFGVPGKADSEDKNTSFVSSTEEKAVQRRFNGSAGDVITSSNTAAIFIEFGKRLTTLEANFKHYGQVIQSIRLLRNETRYLNQENSALRRYVFALQRDRDMQQRTINRIKIENRHLKQEVKELHDHFKLPPQTEHFTKLLPKKNRDDFENETKEGGSLP